MKSNRLFAFIAIVALSACGNETAGNTHSIPSFGAVGASSALAATTPASTPADKAQAAFIRAFRKDFVRAGVESCIKAANGDEARPVCECTINKINDGLTDEEVIAMSKGSDPKDLIQRMDKALASCTQ